MSNIVSPDQKLSAMADGLTLISNTARTMTEMNVSATVGMSATVGEMSATVGEMSATVGEMSATVGEMSATVGKMSATVGKLNMV